MHSTKSTGRPRRDEPNEQLDKAVQPWRSYAGAYCFILAAATLHLCSWEPLRAQQRDPAVEIYGLAGTYYFGNSSNVLKNREWNPQVAVGALFPVGSKWGLMIDGVTSRLEVNEGPHDRYTDHPFSEFYRVNPEIQNNDVTTQRLIAILPSFVRLWRRDRFSIYIGGGLGLEHQRQHIRYQQAFPQENPDGSSTLVREDEFVDSRDAVSAIPLIFRAGILLNLAPRVVLRGGYSHIITYLDAPASKSLRGGDRLSFLAPRRSYARRQAAKRRKGRAVGRRQALLPPLHDSPTLGQFPSDASASQPRTPTTSQAGPQLAPWL